MLPKSQQIKSIK